jgi:hypothetical protein
MITRIIVRCEVCPPSETIPAQHGTAQRLGWKFENGKYFGMHLCPAHSRLSGYEAKEKAWLDGMTPAPSSTHALQPPTQ